MNTNMTKTLPLAVGAGLILILVLSLATCGKKSGVDKPKPDEQKGSSASAEGDSPAEVLRMLTQKMTRMEQKLSETQTEQRTNQNGAGDLAARMAQMEARLGNKSGAPAAESSDAMKSKDVEIAELRRKLDEYQKGGVPVGSGADGAGFHLNGPAGDIPDGLGYEGKGGGPKSVLKDVTGFLQRSTAPLTISMPSPTSIAGVGDSDGMVTIAALNAPEGKAGGGLVGAALRDGAESVANDGPIVDATNPYRKRHSPGDKRGPGEEAEPVYTIPANATLLGAVSMTALIGRVPNNGSVQDPYLFKVVTGAENLATNGISIPGLQGMVWQGTAVGDWGLSCVRGTLDTVTFTFQDGTIRTMGLRSSEQQSGQQGLSSQSGSASGRALAWISDAQGVCISGERITNAAPVLAARMATSALDTAARAYAQSETSTILSGSTGAATTLLTGDAAKYGVGMGVSGGAADMRRWLDERLAQTFDAIYAPPGKQIVIHVNSEIAIDYDPIGRKVTHEAEDDHSHSLD